MKIKDIESKNYYEVLGVSQKSTKSEIKMAYREIARIYHPDSNFYSDFVKNDLNDQSVEIFKRITAAYHTLVDPERRSEYDKSIPQGLNDWENNSHEEDSGLGSNISSSYRGKPVSSETDNQFRSGAYGVFGKGVEISSKEEIEKKIIDSRKRTATFHKTPNIIEKLRKMLKD